jgi:hypothetical protein
MIFTTASSAADFFGEAGRFGDLIDHLGFGYGKARKENRLLFFRKQAGKARCRLGKIIQSWCESWALDCRRYSTECKRFCLTRHNQSPFPQHCLDTTSAVHLAGRREVTGFSQ